MAMTTGQLVKSILRFFKNNADKAKPTRFKYIVKNRDSGKLHCCGLGAAYLEVVGIETGLQRINGKFSNSGRVVWDWLETTGISERWCEGFLHGFDQARALYHSEDYLKGHKAGVAVSKRVESLSSP